jgi:hypothetical protein
MSDARKRVSKAKVTYFPEGYIVIVLLNPQLVANLHFFIKCLLAGTPEDKLRLFMIFYISGPTMSAVSMLDCSLVLLNFCRM